MFIAALAVIVCTIYAQDPPPSAFPPKPSPPYDGNSGASMSPSSSSSSYCTKPPYGPTYYPEYSPAYDHFHPGRHYSGSSSISSGYDCDCCPHVVLSYKNSVRCFRSRVEYLKRHCKAVVFCDSLSGNVLLVTNKETFGEAVGITKVIQCKRGKWTAKDIHDDHVKFRGLRCLRNVPVE